MSEIHQFKRNFFYDIRNLLAAEGTEKIDAIFVTGPRKCGKTTCMEQLARDCDNSIYFDFKTMTDDEKIDAIDEAIDAIKENKKAVYLIDEISEVDFPDLKLAKMAHEFTIRTNTNTRVVITGSQSLAIETWASKAFSGNRAYIQRVNFLDYPEWLVFKGISEVSAETYNQFLLQSSDFYNFPTLEDYLRGCLDDTVQSNINASKKVPYNDCEFLNEKKLLSILYAVLISRHSQRNIGDFFDYTNVVKAVRSFEKEAFRNVGESEVSRRVENIFFERMNEHSAISLPAYKQALNFLCNCGLMTLTYISPITGVSSEPTIRKIGNTLIPNTFENVLDVYTEMRNYHDGNISNKQLLFDNINMFIRYPMFYVEIVKELLGEYMPDVIKGDLLGGVVECHVRGLLPQDNQYEYQRTLFSGPNVVGYREIDYINFASRTAIEITAMNKDRDEYCFEDFPSDFRKILLTKDITGTTKDGIVKISYYNFIFSASPGKELFKKFFDAPSVPKSIQNNNSQQPRPKRSELEK